MVLAIILQITDQNNRYFYSPNGAVPRLLRIPLGSCNIEDLNDEI